MTVTFASPADNTRVCQRDADSVVTARRIASPRAASPPARSHSWLGRSPVVLLMVRQLDGGHVASPGGVHHRRPFHRLGDGSGARDHLAGGGVGPRAGGDGRDGVDHELLGQRLEQTLIDGDEVPLEVAQLQPQALHAHKPSGPRMPSST